MGSKVEILRVDVSITSRLTADPTLRSLFTRGEVNIHADEAPSGYGADRWIVFATINAPDTAAMGGEQVMSSPKYVVSVNGRDTGYVALMRICDAVHAVLNAPGYDVRDGVYVGRWVRTHVMKDSVNVKDATYFSVKMVYECASYDGSGALGQDGFVPL